MEIFTRQNQILDDAGRVRYAGSTVQQNFGETLDKGFLLWDIQSKDSFTCKHISIPNPKPFISISLTPNGKVPETKVVEGARIRLIAENSLSSIAMRKAVDVAKKKYKPESISFIARSLLDNSVEIADNFKKRKLARPSCSRKINS